MWIHGVTSLMGLCEKDNYSEAGTMLLSLEIQ